MAWLAGSRMAWLAGCLAGWLACVAVYVWLPDLLHHMCGCLWSLLLIIHPPLFDTRPLLPPPPSPQSFVLNTAGSPEEKPDIDLALVCFGEDGAGSSTSSSSTRCSHHTCTMAPHQALPHYMSNFLPLPSAPWMGPTALLLFSFLPFTPCGCGCGCVNEST